MDQRMTQRRITVVVVAAMVASFFIVPLVARSFEDDTNSGDENGNGNSRADEVTAVVYQFNDASVAPEYHRSYTVIVSEGQARLEVYSYEETLHDVTAPIDAALWQRTVEAALGFDGAESAVDDGCTGGTSDRLTVLGAGEQELFEVVIDNCDGSGANVVEAVAEVLPLFDLDTLLATA